MFCYQCDQTTRNASGIGCAGPSGVCGKDAPTSDLQDLLIHQIKGIAQYATRARGLGWADPEVDRFILYGLFTTLTNVNFNTSRFGKLIREAAEVRDRVRAAYVAAAARNGLTPEVLEGPAAFTPAESLDDVVAQAAVGTVRSGEEAVGADVVGLRSLILYGMKGVAAYAYHARMLGQQRDSVDSRVEALLDYLAGNPADIGDLLEHALEVGRLNLDVMEMLDAANTGTFGAQEITRVRVSPVKGKAILVSGHDMHDLHLLLEQTRDMGINVYTHGELLPAHAYPKLKAYPHLVGNYGGAWQDQQAEFANFPGPVIVTSNCIIEPDRSYRNRVFTTGPVGWPGVRHLEGGDFSAVIQAARATPGFADDAPEKFITVGFARHTLLGVADQVIDAVKSGAIRHFFLVGGCDGPSPKRQYFTDVAKAAPDDTVILTLGCGKYRVNREEYGAIGGIPRLLDVGQCNDAHSAIQVAGALAQAFGCAVTDLPLSYMISWLEQKATAIFLSMLALGIKGIHLGPTLPAYLTPNLLAVLQERYDVRPIGDARADVAAALKAA